MTRDWNFSTPRRSGIAARQAHSDIPDGLWERELGRDGFIGPVTEFYHRNPPTTWTQIAPNISPHLLDPERLSLDPSSPWNAAELLVNKDLRFRFWRTASNMDHLVRNADGDELMFVHRGSAEFFCDFGHMSLRQGDYLLIPKGTMWRVETSAELDVLLIEATRETFSLPRSPVLGRHMPFDLGVMGVPEIDEAFQRQARGDAIDLRIKRNNQVGVMRYPFNPLDAEGWQGDLYPVKFNIEDFQPVSSHRMRMPPSAYSTFISARFVVCTFVPHPSPTAPGALTVPSFHDNIDYDEIMFMHDGSKTHRVSAFRPGALTFHPAGIPHGPHPSALSMFHNIVPRPMESVFIMVDCRNPLELGTDGAACSLEGYGMTWREGIEFAPDAPAETKRSNAA